MDKETAALLLELAEQRAKEAAERTARQRKVVAAFEDKFGRQSDEAHELLDQFELPERILLQECDRLRTIRDQPIDQRRCCARQSQAFSRSRASKRRARRAVARRLFEEG
jgi:hypothetical protein